MQIQKIKVYLGSSDFPSYYIIRKIALNTIKNNQTNIPLIVSVYYNKTAYVDCTLIDNKLEFIGGYDFCLPVNKNITDFNNSIINATVTLLTTIDRNQNVTTFDQISIGNQFDFCGEIYTKQTEFYATNEKNTQINFEKHHKVMITIK